MPDSNPDELRKLIDKMQSGLVDLFDQLHELKRRLDIVEQDQNHNDTLPVIPIFSEVSKQDDEIQNEKASVELREAAASKPITPKPKEDDHSGVDTSTTESDTKIARVLDPILHELRTGEAPAEVIAEYLQAAKDYLLPEETVNEKVAHDMDLVLKFLRARGTKSIRPEERDSILKRIGQWKKHLARSGI